MIIAQVFCTGKFSVVNKVSYCAKNSYIYACDEKFGAALVTTAFPAGAEKRVALFHRQTVDPSGAGYADKCHKAVFRPKAACAKSAVNGKIFALGKLFSSVRK